MNAGDIITRPLSSIASTTSVFDAAKTMVDQNIGLLVICDAKDGTKLVGVISMRDLVGERATLTAILQSHEKEIFVGGGD